MHKCIVAYAKFVENADGSVTVEFRDLPIVTEGDTLEEADYHARDALRVFVSSLLAEGLLEKVLEQHGVPVYELGTTPTLPEVSDDSPAAYRMAALAYAA